MRIEEVLVLGAGAIGREIALQCAMFGYRTTLYDISREALNDANAFIGFTAPGLAGTYVAESSATIRSHIYYTSDLEEASASADLVSENLPEDPHIKGKVLGQVDGLAPPHAIFATNSSSLMPSMFADMTGRPERLLALHFHKTVWISNVVDVMPHARTDPNLVGVVTDFARSIGQIPIVLRKETQGYVFNSMLQAYMTQAMALWASDTASFEDIDRAWMVAERSAHGPFGAMDFIGLDTIYDIMRHWAAVTSDALALAAGTRLKVEFIDRGRLGVKSGRGFYSYPDPAYQDLVFVDAANVGSTSSRSG